MCLAVPGQIISIEEPESTGDLALMRMGKVSFGGIFKSVNLACVPEAEVGDYVIVHVGFALSVLDPEEARETLDYLKAMEASTAPESV
jgi:hydrogenase expression/formation protein HypC